MKNYCGEEGNSVVHLGIAQKNRQGLTSHRSTIYPCYVPILGDLTGAGRERLTRRKIIKLFGIFHNFDKIYILTIFRVSLTALYEHFSCYSII